MILDGNLRENIEEASRVLARGDLVAFPTETVYGLGADFQNEAAVKKIFKLKGRPFLDPLIVHALTLLEAKELCSEWPDGAEKLAVKYWPGPLTLVLRKSKKVSNLITAGLNTVAVRIPSHPVARKLLEAFGGPIAAPSANKFQSLSPTKAKDVEAAFGETGLLTLDGGSCQVGLESTIIRVGLETKILRLGAITVEDLEIALEKKLSLVENAVLPLAPGMMEFHYAPQKPLKLFSVAELETHLSALETGKLENMVLLCFSHDQSMMFESCGFSKIWILSPNSDLDQAATNLYAFLRECDKSTAGEIYALRAPEAGLGLAINDRLKKAEH